MNIVIKKNKMPSQNILTSLAEIFVDLGRSLPRQEIKNEPSTPIISMVRFTNSLSIFSSTNVRINNNINEDPKAFSSLDHELTPNLLSTTSKNLPANPIVKSEVNIIKDIDNTISTHEIIDSISLQVNTDL